MSDRLKGQHMLAGVSCLIFDFDGPLCDVFSGLSAPTVARRLEELAGQKFDTEDPLVVAQRCRLTASSAVADLVEDALIAHEVHAIETAHANDAGVSMMLAGRSAGYTVAVVSNNSADAVNRFLVLRGLQGVVQAVVGRQYRRPDLMKPNPWPLRHALNVLHVAPTAAILVGDSVTDVEANHAAGMRCIALANKPGKRDAFVQTSADYVIDNMADMRIQPLPLSAEQRIGRIVHYRESDSAKAATDLTMPRHDDLYSDVDKHPEALVSLTDDGWVWRLTGQPLSFDDCEELGLDGTLRDT